MHLIQDPVLTHNGKGYITILDLKFDIETSLEEVLWFFSQFNIVLKDGFINRVNRYQLSSA